MWRCVLRKHNSFQHCAVWVFFSSSFRFKNAPAGLLFLACHADEEDRVFLFWRPKRVRTNVKRKKRRKECLLRTRTPFFESRNRPTRRRRRRRLLTLPEDERRRWRLQRPPPLLFTAVAFLVVSTKNTKIETNRRRRRRVLFVILFIKEGIRSCLRPSKWKMKTITTARRQ